MVVLYSETDIVDQALFFEEDLPNWNKVIKSGIHLCLNLSDEELESKLENPEDPIFIAINQSATMLPPIALKTDIERIKNDLSLTIDYPRSVFLLEVGEDEASDTRINYGTATYSTNNYPDNPLAFSYYVELAKDDKIVSNWKGIINFDKPLSNSLIISDNYLFTNEDDGDNRGFSNLINFVDAFLPNALKIEYQITIFSQDCDRPNDWWVREFGKLTSAIRNLRDYDIRIELVLNKSIHKRLLVSNYVIGKTDQGYDVFHAKNQDIVRFDNDFEHNEIFANINNSGTKYFQSATNTLNKLEPICSSVSDFVKSNANTAGLRLFGCNPDKIIKNRLLN